MGTKVVHLRTVSVRRLRNWKKLYATACFYATWANQDRTTTDATRVTCGLCKRTKAWREAIGAEAAAGGGR